MRKNFILFLLLCVSVHAFALKSDRWKMTGASGLASFNALMENGASGSDFISDVYRRRPTRRYRSSRSVSRRYRHRTYRPRRAYRTRSRVARGNTVRRRPVGYTTVRGFRMPSQKIRHYVNYEGITVQRPTYYDSRPAGASARCRDGSYSFSLHRRGTCSGHGGVAEWY